MLQTRWGNLEGLDSGPGPRSAVVYLHGRGANAEDLVSLSQELGLPGVRSIFPNGLLPYPAVPGGREWFDLQNPSPAGLERAFASVEVLIRKLLEEGAAAGRTALVGFSQGAALALDLVVHSKIQLAACASLSGILARLPAQIQTLSGTRFFVAHGLHDDVLPVHHGREAARRLRDTGAEVSYKEYPMGHTIIKEEILDLGQFLAETLGLGKDG